MMMDAGQVEPPPMDAGEPPPELDAGQTMEPMDAGPVGEMLPPQSIEPMKMPDDGLSQLRPGCGCNASPIDSMAMIVLLAVAAWLGLRRQH
jgi:uncharacterized protein (TIGR03382 family)